MKPQQPLFAVVLAAGKGTRMKSERAKVLHEIFFAPMITHVIRAIEDLALEKIVVIVGHQRNVVMQALSGYNVEFAFQEEQLGTGHAVLCTEEILPATNGVVMILCGDAPLLNPATLESMHRQHLEQGSVLTIMSTILDDPTNYGRLLKNEAGKVTAIVEEKDATAEQRLIKEINAGVYCVDRNFLFDALKKIGTENSQGEVYLTDIVAIAVAAGHPVDTFVNPWPQDILGVNSRVELAMAHKEIQHRRNHQLMLDGVTMLDPNSISVAHLITIGRDSTLEAGVRITGKGSVGASCLIETGALLHNCTIGDNVVIGAYSCLEGVTCPAGTAIAPHSVRRNRSQTPA